MFQILFFMCTPDQRNNLPISAGPWPDMRHYKVVFLCPQTFIGGMMKYSLILYSSQELLGDPQPTVQHHHAIALNTRALLCINLLAML